MGAIGQVRAIASLVVAAVVLGAGLLAFGPGTTTQNSGNIRESPPSPPSPTTPPDPGSGLEGTVYLVEGDCMPSVDAQRCRTSTVSRTIYVFEPYPCGDPRDCAGYVLVPTPLVALTVSSSEGHYRVFLPPGVYSIVVDDQGREYCNWTDGRIVCGVLVPDGMLEFNMMINHAVY